MKYIDLHVHSTASDGTMSPAELVDHAIDCNVSAFALTDHDTLQGITEAKERADWQRKQGHPVEIYSGVEISAAFRGGDIHILGLLVDETNEHLVWSLQDALENRGRRNEKMLARFADLGIPLTLNELCGTDKNTVITRAHFATALLNRGIVASVAEAFDKYLNPSGPCYVPRNYMEPEDAIQLIRRAGGVPVLAHPLLYGLTHEELFSLIERLTKAGLEGLEVFYSNNRGQDETNLRALASHFSLCMTGGSDFHGSVKPTIELGSGKGNLKIPYSVLEHLKERKAAL